MGDVVGGRLGGGGGGELILRTAGEPWIARWASIVGVKGAGLHASEQLDGVNIRRSVFGTTRFYGAGFVWVYQKALMHKSHPTSFRRICNASHFSSPLLWQRELLGMSAVGAHSTREKV